MLPALKKTVSEPFLKAAQGKQAFWVLSLDLTAKMVGKWMLQKHPLLREH